MRLRDIGIGKRLGVGFGIITVLMLVVGIFAVVGLSKLNMEIETIIYDRLPKVVTSKDIIDNANVNARALRNMILFADDTKTVKAELKRIYDARAIMAADIEKMGKFIKDTEGSAILETLKDAVPGYLTEQDNCIRLIEAGNSEEAKRSLLTTVRAAQAAYINAADGLIAHQQKLMEKSGKDAAERYRTSRNFIVLVLLGVLVFTVAINYLVTRSITQPMDKAVSIANALAEGDLTVKIEVDGKDEAGRLLSAMQTMVISLRAITGKINTSSGTIASSSEELSTTVEQITKRVNDQANKANQVATAATEMSQTVIDIAKNASNISVSSNDTLQVAHDGEGIVTKTVNEVQEISRTVSESSKLITSLGERSKQIGEIIDVIKDIADQTNLLALNAAIESARAGEQGRGFAVVADEVRKLAERTSKATTEISGMIQGIRVRLNRRCPRWWIA
ncbi:MAG: methyl-accepting chemotaxis protein [Dissulfurispiraceae bacterium]|jgi:methyl-accepting chemotaxis protein